MPFYTDLPSAWQTEIEKKTGARYVLEVIYDPDGKNVTLSGQHDIISMSTITDRRDLDPEWISSPTAAMINIIFNDPDNYFNPRNVNSPFHNAVGELDRDHASGATSIKIYDETGLAFVAGECLEIYGIDYTDGSTNPEEIWIDDFTAGSGTTYYHEITYNGGIVNNYAKGSKVYTLPIYNKQVLIRLNMIGCIAKITIFRGRMINSPKCLSGKAIIQLVDLKRINLDEILIGADSGADTKLMKITADGLVNSVEYSAGAGGTMDRTKVFVEAVCMLGLWTATFLTATTCQITGPGEVDVDHDITLGLIKMLDSTDDANFADLYSITKDGNYIYMVSDKPRLVIYDVTDPTAPSLSGDCAAPGSSWQGRQVKVSGNYAYIISGIVTKALTSFDISDPANPSQADQITDGDLGTDFDPFHIDILGNYAFVTSSDHYLYIFNITDPLNLALESTFGGAGAPNYFDGPSGVDVTSNKYAYVVTNDDYLVVVDVSDEAVPVLAGTLSITCERMYDVQISGNYAYICDPFGNFVKSVDITDPTDPQLAGTLQGLGEPNYMGGAYSLEISGNFAYVMSTYDNAIVVLDISYPEDMRVLEKIIGRNSPNYAYIHQAVFDSGYLYGISTLERLVIYKFSTTTGMTSNYEQKQLVFHTDAWGGTFAEGDVVTFLTGISYDNQNLIDALYDLYVNKIGLDSVDLDCSGYFGAKEIGTLHKAVSAGGGSIEVNISMPYTFRSSWDQFTITEGATSETVTCIQVAPITGYPPTITFDITALVNSYSSGATVSWTRISWLNLDHTFDIERHYCDVCSYSISLTLDREMTNLEAIEVFTQHMGGFVFSDNWGRQKVFSFKPRYDASPPAYAKNTNIEQPHPEQYSLEELNEFMVKWGYDYINQEFENEYKYPETDAANFSYQRISKKKQRTILLPGYWDGDIAKSLVRRAYWTWYKGLDLVKFNANLQAIIQTIGDKIDFDSEYPDIDTELDIIGIEGITFLPEYKIELLGLDTKFIYGNYLLAGIGRADLDRVW